jgi:hypothetical protein
MLDRIVCPGNTGEQFHHSTILFCNCDISVVKHEGRVDILVSRDDEARGRAVITITSIGSVVVYTGLSD